MVGSHVGPGLISSTTQLVELPPLGGSCGPHIVSLSQSCEDCSFSTGCLILSNSGSMLVGLWLLCSDVLSNYMDFRYFKWDFLTFPGPVYHSSHLPDVHHHPHWPSIIGHTHLIIGHACPEHLEQTRLLIPVNPSKSQCAVKLGRMSLWYPCFLWKGFYQWVYRTHEDAEEDRARQSASNSYLNGSHSESCKGDLFTTEENNPLNDSQQDEGKTFPANEGNDLGSDL